MGNITVNVNTQVYNKVPTTGYTQEQTVCGDDTDHIICQENGEGDVTLGMRGCYWNICAADEFSRI